jgi:hypothetical protein
VIVSQGRRRGILSLTDDARELTEDEVNDLLGDDRDAGRDAGRETMRHMLGTRRSDRRSQVPGAGQAA